MNPDTQPSSLARWHRRWSQCLDHLKLPARLTVIVWVLAAPLLVASGWAAWQTHAHANDAQTRESSVALLRQISDLLGTVGEHRGLTTRILVGTEGLGGELLLTQQQLRAQASQLDQALLQAGIALARAGHKPIRAEAETLIQIPDAKAPERNFESHNDLANHLLVLGTQLQIRLLASFSADEGDAARTHAAVFLGLPQVAEQLARQRGYGTWVLARPTSSPQALRRYGFYATQAQQSLRALTADRALLAELEGIEALPASSPAKPAHKRPMLSTALADAEAFSHRSETLVFSFPHDDAMAEQHFSEGSAALQGLTAVSAALANRLDNRAVTDREQAARHATWALVSLVLSVSLTATFILTRGGAR